MSRAKEFVENIREGGTSTSVPFPVEKDESKDSLIKRLENLIKVLKQPSEKGKDARVVIVNKNMIRFNVGDKETF